MELLIYIPVLNTDIFIFYVSKGNIILYKKQYYNVLASYVPMQSKIYFLEI